MDTENVTIWPDEVNERLSWWSENNGKTLEEAQELFTVYLREKLGIDNPRDEDEDFLVDSAESFVVERRTGGSRQKTVTFVGYFVGVDKKVTDRREGDREAAVNAARQNLNAAIANGIVGRGYVDNGRWMMETNKGIVQTEDSADGDDPWWLVRDGDLNLAVLQTNAEWSSYGKPIRPTMWARTYYFLGNTQDAFEDSVKLWAIRVSDPTEPPSFAVAIGHPVKCKVMPPRENQQTDIPFVTAANKFMTTIQYTDDFVDEAERAFLAPEKLWTGHELYTPLPELEEVFHSDSKMVPGIANAIGPLVIVKGKVTDVNREGWDDTYGTDPTGKRYPMRISSFALQRAFPDGLRREVSCLLHGHLVQSNHAFEYRDGDRWLPYADKSTVFIFGRLGMRTINNDDGTTDEIPKINALGVYAVPRLVIPAGEGGDTSLNQYGGGLK